MLDLRCQTCLELQAQRRCIPVRSGASCFQNPRRSCRLPVWSLCAGLWSRQRCKLWVPPAAGTGGLCSFGLSPSAATVSSKKQPVDNTQGQLPKRIDTNQISLSWFLSLFPYWLQSRTHWLQEEKITEKINDLFRLFFFFKAKIGKWKDCADLQPYKKVRVYPRVIK